MGDFFSDWGIPEWGLFFTALGVFIGIIQLFRHKESPVLPQVNITNEPKVEQSVKQEANPTMTQNVNVTVNIPTKEESHPLASRVPPQYIPIMDAMTYAKRKFNSDASLSTASDYAGIAGLFTSLLRSGDLIARGLYLGESAYRDFTPQEWEHRELIMDTIMFSDERLAQTRSVLDDPTQKQLTELQVDMNQVKKQFKD